MRLGGCQQGEITLFNHSIIHPQKTIYLLQLWGYKCSNLSEVNKPHAIQPINRLHFLSNTTYLQAFYNLFYPYLIHPAYPSKSEKVKRWKGEKMQPPQYIIGYARALTIFWPFHLFPLLPLSCLQVVTFLTFENTSCFLFSLQITFSK